MEECELFEGKLECNGYAKPSFPYREAYRGITELELYGSFREMKIDERYLAIRELSLQSHEIVDYDWSDIPTSVDYFVLFTNEQTLTSNCELLRKATNLRKISLGSQLTEFDFSCLPPAVEEVILSRNQIGSLRSGESLRALTSLRTLKLGHNRLRSFDFGQLPAGVENLHLGYNQIKEFDLRQLNALTSATVELRGNRLSCDCQQLWDFVAAFSAGNVRCYSTECLSCEPGSKLSSYPWKSNVAALVAWNEREGLCSAGNETIHETYNRVMASGGPDAPPPPSRLGRAKLYVVIGVSSLAGAAVVLYAIFRWKPFGLTAEKEQEVVV